MDERGASLHGRLLLVGIGGYGGSYWAAIRPAWQAGRVQVTGVVDPLAERAAPWAELSAAGVPRFDRIEDAAGVHADLAVISSPIAFHAEQTCAALSMGMAVLVEKPLAATVQEADRMIAAREAADRPVGVGYQWSYSAAVQALKADILAGRLGAPRRLRTRVAWPRDSVYYGRNSWAGRLHDAAGRWVLDSPVNNAVAHYLFNMLYVIGPRVDLSARPLSVAGELYRANAIENYDAACLRVRTEPEAELLFYAAHCVRVSEGPIFVYEFEKAEVRYEGKGSIVAFFRNGEQRDYGAPDGVPDVKLAWCLAAARNAGPPVPCGIEAARSHTLVMNGLQEAGVRPFPVERVSRVPWGPEGRAMLTCVDGLEEDLRTAFEAGALFSETGRPWASPAHFRDLREYRAFPVGGETVCRDAAAVPPAARP